MAAYSADLRKLVAQNAALAQAGRPDPELAARIRAVSREGKIRRLIEQAPPLPADSRARLARLLAPRSGAEADAEAGAA